MSPWHRVTCHPEAVVDRGSGSSSFREISRWPITEATTPGVGFMCAVTPPAQIHLPNSAQAPATARAFLRGAACSTHQAQVFDEAELLVSELATNAVLHGAPRSPGASRATAATGCACRSPTGPLHPRRPESCWLHRHRAAHLGRGRRHPGVSDHPPARRGRCVRRLGPCQVSEDGGERHADPVGAVTASRRRSESPGRTS